MVQLLRQSDTLRLTGAQADTLAMLNCSYVIQLDSLWIPVTHAWAQLPTEYDEGETYARYRQAREASVDLLIAIGPRISRLLTAEQRRKLPAFVAAAFEERYLESVRSSTVGAPSTPRMLPSCDATWRQPVPGVATFAFDLFMASRNNSFQVACFLAALMAIAPSLPAQQRPAARRLGPALATSEPFVALSAVRALSGGRVLVNDPGSRRVLLLDSSLKIVRVVADSTANTANAYGARPGALIPYLGDSTLFVDPSSLSMLVLDDEGKIARIMAAPRPSDVGYLLGGPFGNPGVDARRRLVYRTVTYGKEPAVTTGQSYTVTSPDTTPLLRYDLATRAIDAAAFVRIPQFRSIVVRTERSVSGSALNNPIPVVDDFAVLPDGTIAIVRGRDYHVDFVAPDGNVTSGAKIPFDWQRLTDDDKSRIIDSTRVVMEMRRGNGSGGLVLGGASAGAGGEPRTVTMTTTVDAATGTRQSTMPTAAAAGLPAPILFVPPGDLSDYRPAFASGAMRGDMEGRLWVRTIPTKPLAAGPEYDVIDRGGTLTERVAIPLGTTIVGFGSSDIVYLGVRDAAGTHLVRARAK